MLQLRLSVGSERAGAVARALERTGGVRRLVRLPVEGSVEEVVISADVTPSGADDVMTILGDLELTDDDYVLAKLEVVAPDQVGRGWRSDAAKFAWIEVMGQARANSRPLGRYLALMGVAAVVAGLGVITANLILIVGAMAVSPDLLPICATCVGLVGARWALAQRALATLIVGLVLLVVTAALMTWLLDLARLLPRHFKVGEGGIGGLLVTDYSTILVAAAAGVAGILAFETRASAAVGVAISVTTVPASAYIGVAIGVQELGRAGDAAETLGLNVAMLLIAGCGTLLVQRAIIQRAARTVAGGRRT